MQILFVDESGTPPGPKKPHPRLFVLGGLIIPEDVWPKLARRLKELKQTFNVEGEIKWRYFAPAPAAAKHNTLAHLSDEEKNTLRTHLLSELARFKAVKVICVVADAQTAYERPYIKTADDLYFYAYKQLTERFQYYLQDLERTVGERVNGIIVCDHRAPRDDERLRDLHARMLTGTKPTAASYHNLIEGLFIAPSHLSVGIQYADLVAGAVYRKFANNDDRFFRLIEPSFRRGPNGSIERYGLVWLR